MTEQRRPTEYPLPDDPHPHGGPALGLAATSGMVAAAVAPVYLTGAQFLTLYLGGALVAGLGSAMSHAVSHAARRQDRVAPPTGEPDRPTSTRVQTGRHAVAGAVVAVLLGVLIAALGPKGWGVTLVLLAVGLAVRETRSRARRVATTPGRSQPTGRQGSGGSALTRCTTGELLEAWRASERLLRTASSPAGRAQVAALRERYLDELERRDPAGVHRWLAFGPHPAADPRLFVRDERE